MEAFEKNLTKICCGVKYQIVMTDINMPVMDGYEATEKMFKLQERFGCNVPIIAVTAYEDQETKDRCLNMGMSAVLTKPVTFDSLEKIVNLYYHGKVSQSSHSRN